MGKKRRLKSAKAKFRAKHSNHPRMIFLESSIEEITVQHVCESVETKIEEEVPLVTKETEAEITPQKETKKKVSPRKRKATTTTKTTTKSKKES